VEPPAQKKTLRAAEQDRPDVKQARDQWRADTERIDPRRLRFIDESGAKTNMVRMHGRCPKGQRLLSSAPAGHWNTTTMIAAIGLDGIHAPFALDGGIDGDAFLAYVEKVLLPTLQGGEIIVMDNLSSHKLPRVAELIQSAGAEVWYLPPYSPDFNPIENMWSKVKQILRSIAARTFDGLVDAIRSALDRVATSDLLGWFTHCGYTTCFM
jgi:transposase